MATMNKLRAEMAQRFLDALTQGQLPWRACWQRGRPVNAITGKLYRGVNAFWLSYMAEEKGYTDPRWCTYNKAEEKGWQVRKGEKACRVEYWAYYDLKQKKLLDWADVRKLLKADPEYAKNLQLRSRVYSVFNAEQIDGMPELQVKQHHTDIGDLRLKRDTLLRNMAIGYEEYGDRAYYSPITDTVTLPPEGSFDDPYAYMCTFLHECGHGTGHPSRLNRDLSGIRGSEAYAREELRAEIASAFAAQALGLQLTDAQLKEHLDLHTAYVQGWATYLKDAPEELFRAIKAAEEISDYLIEKGEFDVVQSQQKSEMKEWHVVYESNDPLDGELVVIPTEDLQGREALQTFCCANLQEATEKLQRYEELQRYFWDETNDPETQEWRDELTSDESAMVEQWEIQTAKGFSQLAQAILDRNAGTEKISWARSVQRSGQLALDNCPNLKEIEYPGVQAPREIRPYVMSPNDLLNLSEQYPGMTREQLNEIADGIHDGLSPAQIASYAQPQFTSIQMNAIHYSISNGLTPEQIDLQANPAFDSVQMDIIRSAFQSDMSMEQVKLFARPEIPAQQMLEAYWAIREGRSWEPPQEKIYGHDVDTWNSMSEGEQENIMNRCEYELQHPDSEDWGIDEPY